MGVANVQGRKSKRTGRISRIGSFTVVAAMAVAGLTVSSASAATSPKLTTKSFTNDFSAMKQLKSLAKSGKGKVAAIMPDTVSSTRYVEFDQPDITKALTAAGLSSRTSSSRTLSAVMPPS